MRKLLLICTLLLSSCSYLQVHKMDIEQGNVITQDMLSRVHLGMTEAQVKEIMGSPVLENVFNKNRMDYLYTFMPGYGSKIEKSVIFVFNNGRLVERRGNLYSDFAR
jgi:outer membrane protein assembly factor BamE